MKTTRDIPAASLQRIPDVGRQSAPTPVAITNEFRLGTEAFASLNQVKDSSVRRRLCVTGSYFGIRPRKLASGRLVWPAVQVGVDIL
jgi:hypothetical protein